MCARTTAAHLLLLLLLNRLLLCFQSVAPLGVGRVGGRREGAVVPGLRLRCCHHLPPLPLPPPPTTSTTTTTCHHLLPPPSAPAPTACWLVVMPLPLPAGEAALIIQEIHDRLNLTLLALPSPSPPLIATAGLLTSGQLSGTLGFLARHPDALGGMVLLSCASSCGVSGTTCATTFPLLASPLLSSPTCSWL